MPIARPLLKFVG